MKTSHTFKRECMTGAKTWYLPILLYSRVSTDVFSSSIYDKLQQTRTISWSQMDPPASIHSLTDVPFRKKVTLLWRLKLPFRWAENCYWIWSWIIGRRVPQQPTNKRRSYGFTVTLKAMTFGSWVARMVCVLLHLSLIWGSAMKNKDFVNTFTYYPPKG